MLIDTGPTRVSKSGLVDEGANVSFTDWTRADRCKRQIIEQVEACETSSDVDEYLRAESLILDALHLYDPAMAEDVTEHAEDHKSRLKSGGIEADAPDPRPADPGNPKAQVPDTGNSATKGKTNMFSIDTGGGSQGPWIGWMARPAQDGSVPAKSFFLRDENGRTPFEGFASGVVLDIEKLKVGWQHSEGIPGRAPDWKWWPAPNQRIEKPSDEYKWGVSIPCAIGGGKTATWEQAGAGVQNAIGLLAPALEQGPAGKLPMVKLTGVKELQFSRGSTNAPILEVVKWVDRPDCLKEGAAAGIDTSEKPAPQQQATAAAPADVSEDIAF